MRLMPTLKSQVRSVNVGSKEPFDLFKHILVVTLFVNMLRAALLPTTVSAQDSRIPIPTLDPQIACQLDGNPVWSPDGQSIAFVSERTGNTDIWVMDADGLNPRNLTADNVGVDMNPLWSPDGYWIAFISGRNDSGDIWLMRPDGTDLINLTEDISSGRVASPAWSPDGRYIAVPSSQDGKVDIWVIDVQSFERTNITADTSESYKWPSWSPDGRQIAFTTYSNDNVFIANADGSGLMLLNDMNFNIRADWSPTTRLIAVSHAVKLGGNIDIWVIDADTSEVVNLTEDYDSVDFIPAWSPDGSMIVFQSDRERLNDIWRMDADGGNLLNLTVEIEGSASLPVWSPDGQQVVFQVYQEDASNIWVVDADGKNPKDLSASQRRCEHD